MRTITTDALTLADIPLDAATIQDLISFSHTFRGYEYWGSLERCAEIATTRDHGSIERLRACLFFEARRWRHCAGSGPDDNALPYWRELISSIRSALAKRLASVDLVNSVPPDIDSMCSMFFRYRDLIECGETQKAHGPSNIPTELASYDSIKDLALNILDPVLDRFGPLDLTYGFSSLELLKKIKWRVFKEYIKLRVSPGNDQHAAHERRKTGSYVCPRLGAACDFKIANADMRQVAEWVYFNTPVDRLYFYGSDRSVHVSYSKVRAHQFVEMLHRHDRLIPKVIKSLQPRSTSEI